MYKEISVDLNGLSIEFKKNGDLIGGAGYSKNYYTRDDIFEIIPQVIKDHYSDYSRWEKIEGDCQSNGL